MVFTVAVQAYWTKALTLVHFPMIHISHPTARGRRFVIRWSNQFAGSNRNLLNFDSDGFCQDPNSAHCHKIIRNMLVQENANKSSPTMNAFFNIDISATKQPCFTKHFQNSLQGQIEIFLPNRPSLPIPQVFVDLLSHCLSRLV